MTPVGSRSKPVPRPGIRSAAGPAVSRTMGRVMETTLHKQLKALYADDPEQEEVVVGPYRIDAVRGEQLVEVQCASLSAIRRKLRDLTADREVLLVKPLAAVTTIVRRDRRGRELSRRRSPKRGDLWALYQELVHLRGVFPHANLRIEVPLCEVEDVRGPRPKNGFTRRRRDRSADRTLIGVRSTVTLRTPEDLSAMLPAGCPDPFDTAELAASAGIPRFLAQKVAYCLKFSGAAEPVAKRGNAVVYRRAA